MHESLSIHLDWFRYTVDFNQNITEETNLLLAKPRTAAFDFTGETFPAGQGYNRGRRLNAGSIFWNTDNFAEGIGVQLTGADLQELRLSPMTEQELLAFVDKAGGRVSTLHSCINVKNAGARPTDVLRAQKNGTLKTRARQIGTYQSQQKSKGKWLPSDTIYIGSPKSSIQIRIYNKAAEQHVDGDWIRIEIIWHGRYAQAAFSAMLTSGIEAVTRGAISRQMDLPVKWWRYAMQGDTSLPVPIPRQESARYKWLSTVVLTALRSEIEEERRQNSDAIYELYTAFIGNLKPDKTLTRN